MNIATSEPSKLSEAEYFSILIDYATESNSSIALWQLPNQRVRNVIISRRYQSLKRDILIETLQPGFIFSPFNKDQNSLFLSADLSFSFENDVLKPPQTALQIESLNWFNEKISTSTKHTQSEANTVAQNLRATNETDFKSLVKKSIAEIEKGKVEKVVPSRYKEIALPNNFDCIESFRKLCQTYPNAFVSFVIIPGIGSWLGATPELLVSIEDKTIFKTIALAGTKPYTENTNLRNVAWTQKEIEEQALVERYIISCFKKIRLREYDEHGPKTFVAGNVMHLKSDFTVNLKETNFPQLGSTMLQLLHPTSAVCGMPLESANDFLKTHEGYDREFYAGFLGPVNFNNDIFIFVNIRCLQLKDNIAICYAGAGVTIDSIPEEEWNETEIKLNTLLKVIF